MFRIDQEVLIARAVDEVFGFVVDDHAVNHPRWDPDVVRVDQLTAGALAVGTAFTMGRRVMGSVQESRLEVVELDRPRRAVMVNDSRAMSITFAHEFSDAGEGRTRLAFRVRVDPHGPLKLMQPFIREQFSKGLRRSLDTIQQLLDADGPTGTSGAESRPR